MCARKINIVWQTLRPIDKLVHISVARLLAKTVINNLLRLIEIQMFLLLLPKEINLFQYLGFLSRLVLQCLPILVFIGRCEDRRLLNFD